MCSTLCVKIRVEFIDTVILYLEYILNMESIICKSAAPALTRGIQILQFLSKNDNSSLHEMTNVLKIPKSSLLRILDEMISLDIVSRNERTGHYYALQKLIPAIPAADQFKEKINQLLLQAAEKTGYTAEWYIPSKMGPILVDRKDPSDKEVKVLAQIGFIRKWDDELEAVSGVGYAFGDQQIPLKIWQYDAQTRRKNHSTAQIHSAIQEIKTNGYAQDLYYNINGVKRIAFPVRERSQLKGIFVLAKSISPIETDDAKKIISSMQRMLQNILK